jgi:signal transduction histidine kinase
MKRQPWLRDSITRRFALAIAAAATVSILLNGIVDALFGGTDPMRQAGAYATPSHWLVRGAVLLFSIMLVSFLGAAKLARPIDAFAVAARRFGADPQAPPMALQGPAEIQLAIAAFNTMQGQIQDFVAGQAAMFAAISHDLRTPLTRMRLRGEFIEDPEQQARLFRDVDEMETMVSAVLSFLRDNATSEEKTNFDLAELLRSIIDDQADLGHQATYTGPEHVPFVGRPIGLRRAFGNLVENAVKYGTTAMIDLNQCPGFVTVTITDQGQGIPADALETVFAPFHRLEPSRNRNTGGMGLGLTSARAGFRAHGGDVTLRNAAGGGLQATVKLPLAG